MRILFDDGEMTMYGMGMYRTFVFAMVLCVATACMLVCSGCPLVKERSSKPSPETKTNPNDTMKPVWEVAD